MVNALPPWRRGLSPSLKTEALPIVVVFQRLYLAVHGVKGGLELTDPENRNLPVIRDCLERLRRFAEGTDTLDMNAENALKAALDTESSSWGKLQSLLQGAKEVATSDDEELRILENALRQADPQMRLDALTKARLKWARSRNLTLHTTVRETTLSELEHCDIELENEYIAQGGLLISRSLTALTPHAQAMTQYRVKILYTAALPRSV